MAPRKPEAHHVVPHCLLTLHEKAHGTSLDGVGIQTWVEWEMEAMRWRVPADISREELEALVDRNTRTSSKPPETISKGKERA